MITGRPWLVWFWLVLGSCAGLPDPASRPPHVLVILADDMGYGDPGCNNPESLIPTPQIDSLARDGMRFRDAHSPAAWCTPTRYGLLTGRYPCRYRGRWGGPCLQPGQPTLASMLRGAGYRTAMVGKWHLGFAPPGQPRDARRSLQNGPLDCGFDEYFGIPSSLDIPPYYYIRGRHAVAPPS